MTFNHMLGDSRVTFCATGRLATRLRKEFPDSLYGSPALLPAESTALRRRLDDWLHKRGISRKSSASSKTAP